MTDKMKQFLEEAGKDAAFAEKLNGADSPETVLALAKEKGFELTLEDLQAALPTGELSDEALDGVAGGMVVNPLGAWGGLTVLLQSFFGGTTKNRAPHLQTAQTLPYRGGAPAAQTMELRGCMPTMAQTMEFRSGDSDDLNKFYKI